MGAEAYGLVGFYAMLQAWFQLLDMGLTPTMTRETARFNGGATDALSLRRLLRALEGVFIGIALLGGLAMVLASGSIANSWLKVQQLSLVEVQHAIILMAVIVALRWVCGLYRGAISGFERLVWLSGFNSAVATARFVMVIPVFVYVGISPSIFFSYQLLIAVLELLVLVVQTYRLLPVVNRGTHTPLQWEPLRGLLKFSLTIAFTSSAWVLVTQTDKLVLSKLLPLADYAYFTLAIMAANGVMLASGPISGALLPRMSKLAAEGDNTGLIHLYRNATQLMVVIAIPVALVLAIFAKEVLLAWTGDINVARKAAPVLTLYALGNGILTLSAFPFFLQFSKGKLRLHMIGSGLFVMLLIPILIWATMHHGVIGAGWAWLGVNVIYFLLWVPKVHGHFMPSLHGQWLLHDVGIAIAASSTVVAIIAGMHESPQNRLQLAQHLILITIALIAVAALSSSLMRSMAKRWLLISVFKK